MTAISTAAMSRDEWLKERTKGIGGSDVSTILGLNPYKTPLQLWEEKTGKSSGSPPTKPRTGAPSSRTSLPRSSATAPA